MCVDHSQVCFFRSGFFLLGTSDAAMALLTRHCLPNLPASRGGLPSQECLDEQSAWGGGLHSARRQLTAAEKGQRPGRRHIHVMSISPGHDQSWMKYFQTRRTLLVFCFLFPNFQGNKHSLPTGSIRLRTTSVRRGAAKELPYGVILPYHSSF